MKKSKNSKIIQALIISIALILSLAVGLWAPRLLQPKGAWDRDEQYQDSLVTPAEESASDNLPEYSGRFNISGKQEDTPELNQTEQNESKKAVLAEIEASEVIEIIEEAKAEAKTELNPAETMDWIDQRIMETGAQVAPEDLEDFQAIVDKLDMPYVEDLVAAGLDETSIEELTSYLYTQLGSQAYQRAKELFQTYQYLLYVE